MGDSAPSYYAVLHCCSNCGKVVWTEDKVAPTGTNPSNIRRSDSLCRTCSAQRGGGAGVGGHA
jgi:hypothetical protein